MHPEYMILLRVLKINNMKENTHTHSSLFVNVRTRQENKCKKETNQHFRWPEIDLKSTEKMR